MKRLILIAFLLPIGVFAQIDSIYSFSIIGGVQRSSTLSVPESNSFYFPYLGVGIERRLGNKVLLNFDFSYNSKGYQENLSSNKFYYRYLDVVPQLEWEPIKDLYLGLGGRVSYATMFQKAYSDGNSTIGVGFENLSINEVFNFGWGAGVSTLVHRNLRFKIWYSKSFVIVNHPNHSDLSFGIAYKMGTF